MSKNTLKLIADSKAEWVDLRFTDTKGKEQHVTVSATQLMKASSPMERCLMALP